MTRLRLFATLRREVGIERELPQVGELFEDRYELLEVLGRGGFAIVYRARDRAMTRDVAIKVMAPVNADAANTVAPRFLREAQVFATLEDPHTITMYDFGESEDELLYMVFEYVRGEDLAGAIRRAAVIHPATAVHITTQLLSALREAHSRGIFHRDIKPANVLLYEYAGDPHRVKLIDFGIAKDTAPSAADITATGNVVGTLRYMAPEQLFGREVGPDTDLFSLGLVAFEMLTGQPAFTGASKKEILLQQVSDEPLLLPERSAPWPLRQVVEQMIARDRGRRYQSAQAALADLRAIVGGLADWAVPDDEDDATTTEDEAHRELSPARSPEDADSSPRGSSRSLLSWLVAVIGLVLVAGAFVYFHDRSRRATPTPTPPPNVSALLLPSESTASPQLNAGVDTRPPATDPNDGCGKRVQPGRSRMSVGFGRSWSVYVPSGYSPDTRHPLLLMFHRSFLDSEGMLDETEMERFADRHGFVVFSFDAESMMTWKTPGNLGYVLSGLDHAFGELCLERSRVYALGDGAGGTFVSYLACAVPLSAVAITNTGEEPGGSHCVPTTPTPRLRIYGKRDRHLPIDGGESCSPTMGRLVSAAELDARWTRHHRCTGDPLPWKEFRGGECRTWSCDVAPLVTCATDGGHFWPNTDVGTLRLPGCDVAPPDETFPYGEAMWQFFEAHGVDRCEHDPCGVP